jgi:hypothetical protein
MAGLWQGSQLMFRLFLSGLRDLFSSLAYLEAENVSLRHQEAMLSQRLGRRWARVSWATASSVKHWPCDQSARCGVAANASEDAVDQCGLADAFASFTARAVPACDPTASGCPHVLEHESFRWMFRFGCTMLAGVHSLT